MNYTLLDQQLRRYSDKLSSAVRLKEDEVGKVATLVASEVRFLEPASRIQILNASPVRLRDRLDELLAFQRWMDIAQGLRDPGVVRAQVITQNYVCFVYLGEACFRALRATSAPNSVTRRCCKFLTDNPVRAFRNAIAHSNWSYAPDYRGLLYWARKGSDPSEPLERFDASQGDLDFWQSLSRGVAYAAYTILDSVGEK